LILDLGAGLRRVRPDRHLTQLKPRPGSDLIAASSVSATGRVLLLADTNVYIHSAAGTLPVEAAALRDRALLFHCDVVLGELAVGVANVDPRRPGWQTIRDHYRALMDRVPETRLLSPDAQTWAEAGLIAGTLARTRGYAPHQRKDCLNDALIYLTAAKAGLAVLTANRDEFDLIQQLAPHGRFIHF
jgi:predicted nucleic acid-binding protein